jgi:hypothetical protein
LHEVIVISISALIGMAGWREYIERYGEANKPGYSDALIYANAPT